MKKFIAYNALALLSITGLAFSVVDRPLSSYYPPQDDVMRIRAARQQNPSKSYSDKLAGVIRGLAGVPSAAVNAEDDASFSASLNKFLKETHSELQESFLSHVAEGDIAGVELVMEPLEYVSANNAYVPALSESTLGVNTRIYAGLTPLELAAFYGQSPMIEFLISQGADVNKQDAWGQTALIVAVKNNQLESAQTLLKQGADSSIKDESGKTAIAWAEEKKYESIIDILKNK